MVDGRLGNAQGAQLAGVQIKNRDTLRRLFRVGESEQCG